MAGWTSAELAAVRGTDEVRVSSYRPDGTLRPFVTIWAVQVDDDVIIRSARGPQNGWFRRARSGGTGRFETTGVARDVRFEAADDLDPARVDAAYHAKYDRYEPQIVGSVVGPQAVEVTLRVVPQD